MMKAVFWYVCRPRFYANFVLYLGQRASSSLGYRNAQRDAATNWCRERAVDTESALEQLTGTTPEVSLFKRFPDEFSFAHQQAQRCPVKMGGAANLEILYYVAEYLKATAIIETGVAYGWSSLALLLSLASRDKGHLISSDRPYPGLGGDEFVGCVVPDHLMSAWQLIRLPDREALGPFFRQHITTDLVHYDSDKSRNGRRWAYPRLWKTLRPGGIMISDDINDNPVFEEFCESVRQKPIIVRTPKATNEKFVGIVLKPEPTNDHRAATGTTTEQTPERRE